MTFLSLSQAARVTGVTRSVIDQHVKNGTLRAMPLNKGGLGIETSELLRVFGQEKGVQEAPAREMTPSAALLKQLIAALERENALLRQELDAARKREQRLLDMLDKRIPSPPPKQTLLGRMWEEAVKASLPSPEEER